MPNLFKKEDKTEMARNYEKKLMSVGKGFVTKTPSVNIMPAYVLEDYRVIALKSRFIISLLVVLILLGSLFSLGVILHPERNPETDKLLSQASEMNEQAKLLTGYQAFYNSVDQKRQELGTLLVSDIDAGLILSTIQTSATNSGVSLSSVTINAPKVDATGIVTNSTSNCPSPDPFGSVSSVGCISFSGIADSRESIARFLEELNATPGFTNAYVPTTTVGDGSDGTTQSQVSGTVSFTQELYTNAYANLSLPLSAVLNGSDTTQQDNSSTTNTAPAVEPTKEP